MKKKIIFLIAFSFIISCTIPIYAANGDTVAPVSSTGNMYYFNGSSNSYTYKTISTWAGHAEGITQAFANSISSLSSQLKTAISSQTTSLNTGLTNIENAVDDVWSRLGIILSSVDQIEGYIDSIEPYLVTLYSYVNDIKGYTDQIETKIDTSNTNTSNIYSVLSNGINIDLGNPWQPYFMPSDDYNFNNSDWRYAWNIRLNADGSVSAGDYYNTNYLILLKRLMQNLSNGINIFGRYMITGVTTSGSDSILTLYDKDLNTTNTGSTSYWYDFRAWASNISSHLARLDFVLASDDEIAAREASQDNQDAFVNDFLDSNGAGSASASDIGDMSGISSGVQDILSTGVSPASAFSSMNSNSSAWDWFKNDTKNALDTTTSNRRNIKSSDSDTPLLDNYYSDLQEKLKVYKK